MASLFWVGGTGSWDNSTAHFATSTGGVASVAAPSSSDDVFFDANSGGGTVTLTSSSNVHTLDFTGFTGAFSGSSPLNVFGNFAYASTMSGTSYNGTLTMSGTVSGLTIATGGKTFFGAFYIGGTGGVWTLQDNFTLNNFLNMDDGTLITNNFTLSAQIIQLVSANNPGLQLGSSTVNLTYSVGTTLILNSSLYTNWTGFNAGTSTIIFNSTADGAGLVSDNANLTFYNVIVRHSNPTMTKLINGSNTFNTLTIEQSSSATPGTVTIQFQNGRTQTINTIIATGSTNKQILLTSTTPGSTATIAVTSSNRLHRVALKDIVGSPTGSLIAEHSYAISNVSGVEVMSYIANTNTIRPHPFSPGLAR